MRAWVTLLTASLLAPACSPFVQPFDLAEDAPKSSDFQRVALLPMNFDRSPMAALAPGAELMGERIRSHLETRGFQVLTPQMSTTLALWKECVANIGGITNESDQTLDPERYARARTELVRRTLESFPADGAISAAVVVREGRYIGDKLSWDGAMRLFPIDVAETNRAVLQLRGRDLGVSLRTTVFDREGRKIFERHAGLETLRGFRVVEGRGQVYVRGDLFQDEAIIEQGIAISFAPWLPAQAK